MALEIIVETGTGLNQSANSYATLEEADRYNESVLEGEVWDDADEPTRIKALVQGARVFDQSFDWFGSPSKIGQPMAHPRRGCGTNPSEIYAAIKQGQCEIARALIARGGMNPVPAAKDAPVKTVILGKQALEVDFFETAAVGPLDINPFTDYLLNLLAPWGTWRNGGGDKIVEVYR